MEVCENFRINKIFVAYSQGWATIQDLSEVKTENKYLLTRTLARLLFCDGKRATVGEQLPCEWMYVCLLV